MFILKNKSTAKPPISMRASNYNGLAINKMKDGTQSSQIWLLAENDDAVLRGLAISNFRMVEDNTGDYYPRENNIKFISLPRLAKERNRYGIASKLLLGEEPDDLSDDLKEITNMFKNEYEVFKQSEEVIKAMTIFRGKIRRGTCGRRSQGQGYR
jgi:hypothetical protein